MKVKLYGMPMSTCTSRAMICLEEQQVEYECVHINLSLLNINSLLSSLKNLIVHELCASIQPFGQIPALEGGDLTIFESRAISAYISENYKENSSKDLLRQENLQDATLVKVWTEVEAQRYEPIIRPITYRFFVAPLSGKTPNQTIINQNVEKLEKVLDIYDAKLGCTKYLAGDYYTLADLHHIPCTQYLMTTPCASLINSRSRVKAWWDEISSRPACKKVCEKMEYVKK